MKICPQCSELYPDDAGFCPLDGTKLVQSADPLLGRTISSRYRLTRKLGTGGMAVVYLARHVMIDRLNAIKILRRDLSLDPNQRERFLREARAVNRINHPNIVEITDFGEFEGTAYLVMEYSPAESLLQLLKRGPLAWDRVVRIAEQIASALSRAHEAGVIHRDLKPENVLILDPTDGTTGPMTERVKLTDFGIAKIVDAPALTFSEQMFGTPGYIAPEYVEGVKADGRADLFSLGVLMYESMTGVLPWDAKGQAELLLRPLTAAPTPLHDRIEVPPELDSLVLALLAKKADDRPPDAFVVHDVLLDILRRYAPSRSAPPPPSTPIRDEIPTTVTEVVQSSNDDRPPMSTAEIGRVQTSELASRWGGAIADIETALARARKKGIAETTAQRASELAAHARSLVDKLERASAQVAEIQGRVDRLQAHAREFRANLGHAIDELGRDRARERSHWSALRTRHEELDVESGAAASQREAQVWEAAALSAEEEHVKSLDEDLTFQIVQLQLQLEAKNERFEKEYAAATGELEGAISAVRAMTHEIVRTLDEATAIVTARKKR